MEGVLWYVFASTRGGENRARLLRAMDERPRNANQLADDLELDYTTVRHHLEVTPGVRASRSHAMTNLFADAVASPDVFHAGPPGRMRTRFSP